MRMGMIAKWQIEWGKLSMSDMNEIKCSIPLKAISPIYLFEFLVQVNRDLLHTALHACMNDICFRES